MGSLRLVAIVLLLGSPVLGSPALAQSSPTYGVGRTPTAEEIRIYDTFSISPTGEELPPGRGTAIQQAGVSGRLSVSAGQPVYSTPTAAARLPGVLLRSLLPGDRQPHQRNVPAPAESAGRGIRRAVGVCTVAPFFE